MDASMFDSGGWLDPIEGGGATTLKIISLSVTSPDLGIHFGLNQPTSINQLRPDLAIAYVLTHSSLRVERSQKLSSGSAHRVMYCSTGRPRSMEMGLHFEVFVPGVSGASLVSGCELLVHWVQCSYRYNNDQPGAFETAKNSSQPQLVDHQALSHLISLPWPSVERSLTHSVQFQEYVPEEWFNPAWWMEIPIVVLEPMDWNQWTTQCYIFSEDSDGVSWILLVYYCIPTMDRIHLL